MIVVIIFIFLHFSLVTLFITKLNFDVRQDQKI